MKTYYATQDIEDMAARGIAELHLDHDTVLTDLARDAAQRLGVKLVQPGIARAAANVPTAQPAIAVATPPPAAARPKGCQHGPLTPPASTVTSDTGAPAGGAGNPAGNTVVDQMVGLVRQLAGKK
jgi:hypothetical protein